MYDLAGRALRARQVTVTVAAAYNLHQSCAAFVWSACNLHTHPPACRACSVPTHFLTKFFRDRYHQVRHEPNSMATSAGVYVVPLGRTTAVFCGSAPRPNKNLHTCMHKKQCQGMMQWMALRASMHARDECCTHGWYTASATVCRQHGSVLHWANGSDSEHCAAEHQHWAGHVAALGQAVQHSPTSKCPPCAAMYIALTLHSFWPSAFTCRQWEQVHVLNIGTLGGTSMSHARVQAWHQRARVPCLRSYSRPPLPPLASPRDLIHLRACTRHRCDKQ